MQKIVTFFKDHIKPHAEWEEKKLYPAVDKRASKGGEVLLPVLDKSMTPAEFKTEIL